MKKVKITVIETSLNKELVDKYATPGLTACTYNTLEWFFIQMAGKSQRDFVTTHGNQ